MEHIRIIAPGDPGFDWLYDLYMQSFPVHEQRLRERQEGVLGHPEYHCDLLCQGETRVGLLMWWAGPASAMWSISPSPRSCGARAGAAGHCVSSWRRETRWCWRSILRRTPVSRRRKGFYEGLGLVSNPWPHIHPPYRLEFSGHALEVMTFPGGWDEGQYRRFARYLDETVMADRPQKVAGA